MTTSQEEIIISPNEVPVVTIPSSHQENNSITKNNYLDDLKPLRKDSAEITWDNGYNNWKLYRIYTPLDGSCLFHAISNSYFEPYHKEILNGKQISKSKMITILRHDLAEKLSSKIDNNVDSPSYYDMLYNGNIKKFAESVPEFTINHMKSQLDSHNPIGYGYIQFIGNCLNKDIYILDASRRDIYVSDELPYTIKGDRNSIVLYYVDGGHYELIGIKTDSGMDTHFNPNHSFIRFLYNRVQEIIINSQQE